MKRPHPKIQILTSNQRIGYRVQIIIARTYSTPVPKTVALLINAFMHVSVKAPPFSTLETNLSAAPV